MRHLSAARIVLFSLLALILGADDGCDSRTGNEGDLARIEGPAPDPSTDPDATPESDADADPDPDPSPGEPGPEPSGCEYDGQWFEKGELTIIESGGCCQQCVCSGGGRWGCDDVCGVCPQE